MQGVRSSSAKSALAALLSKRSWKSIPAYSGGGAFCDCFHHFAPNSQINRCAYPRGKPRSVITLPCSTRIVGSSISALWLAHWTRRAPRIVRTIPSIGARIVARAARRPDVGIGKGDYSETEALAVPGLSSFIFGCLGSRYWLMRLK